VDRVHEVAHHRAAGACGTYFCAHGVAHRAVEEVGDAFDAPDLSEDQLQVLHVLLGEDARERVWDGLVQAEHVPASVASGPWEQLYS